MEDFTTAFADADSLFLLDIYAASEKPIEGVTAEALVHEIVEKGSRSAVYMPSVSEAIAAVTNHAQPGDMILTLGAGSVSQIGPLILEKLEKQPVVPIRE